MRAYVLCGGFGTRLQSVTQGTQKALVAVHGVPFLQVVFNNRGWKAPRFSTLAVHGQGYAAAAEDIGVTFDPPPDHAGIAAAAGGAFARKVERASDLPGALAEAMHAVKIEQRAAVLDVWLPHLMA